MKKLLGLVLGIVLLAAPAFAADVDGKWTGMIETPMGALPVGFTFKSDGNALSGTSLGPDGAEIAIKDGKIDGNKIAFTVAIDFGGMAIVLSYSGVVSPEKIQFTGDFMGMPFEFVVDKAK
jgi:opacity protein-like surface antigen